jgi:hypothetical protein
VKPESPGGPKISLEQLSTDRNGAPGYWRIEWRIENGSSQPIRVRSVRLPHGQFKSEEQRFDPPIDLKAGQQGQFQTRVHSHEPPGLITENAFMIFHVTWLDEPWRVFVRLRVTMTEERRPKTATELITSQKVGFSGVPL